MWIVYLWNPVNRCMVAVPVWQVSLVSTTAPKLNSETWRGRSFPCPTGRESNPIGLRLIMKGAHWAHNLTSYITRLGEITIIIFVGCLPYIPRLIQHVRGTRRRDHDVQRDKGIYARLSPVHGDAFNESQNVGMAPPRAKSIVDAVDGIEMMASAHVRG